MIDFLEKRNHDVIRESMRELQAAKLSHENAIVDEAILYFDRQLDHGSIRKKMKSRFAVGIKKVSPVADSDVNETGLETYTKEAVKEQIDQGFIEVLTSGVGNKIVDALANLFDQPTQSWTYLNGETADEGAAELIAAHREAGGADTTLSNGDSLSSAINTSLILLTWASGHLKYQIVLPTNLHLIYHETITDNGVSRGVDYGEMDDATAIVIKLADYACGNNSVANDPGESQYLAIFGRSEVYEYGRYVTYRANKWDSIPEPDQGGIDYRVPVGFAGAGELANPLSWLAELNQDQPVPEYPLIKLDGGLSRIGNKLIETTTSLYENMLEIDVAYSRLLKDALSSARGKDVITNSLGGPIPRTLEGAVLLQGGQTLEVTGRPGINSKQALDVLESVVVSVGNGYSVPDYMLVSDASSLVASSGVALMIRTAPLINMRNYRIKINRSQVARLFDIERYLIETHTGDQSLRGVVQGWDPGEFVIPEDPLEKVTRIKAAQDANYIDYVMAVKDANNLATEDEAEALIKKMRERPEELQPPKPPQPPQQPQQRGAKPVGINRSQPF